MSPGELPDRDAVELALACARRAGAQAADATLDARESLEARVRGSEIDFVKQARERQLEVRAFVRAGEGVRAAAVQTSDLAPGAVERMVQEAVALARATAPDAAAGLPEDGFDATGADLGLLDPEDRRVPLEERIGAARRAEEAARRHDSRVWNSEGSQVSSENGRVTYGNTLGFLGAYDWALHALYSEPVARANGSMQRDHWATVARRLRDLEPPERVGERAAERAVRRLGARRVPTCEVPVIFEPRTARSLLGNLAGCLNGIAIYRNASFLAERLGEVVAAPSVSVVDDGRRPGGLGSRPFDAEGQPTRRNLLVERGRLASYLLDTYCARKLGLASTGNAARGAGGGTTPAPTNLWLEPGELSLEEIIARTERGLLVTELIGMGFNPVTGDYSRGAAGFWIEGGEIVHPVEEITVAGHLGRMLESIDLVGSDLLWLGPVAAPSLRVAAMTVAGE